MGGLKNKIVFIITAISLSAAFFIFPFFYHLIFAAEKIDINTASLDQLKQIVGVGDIMGQRIIDGRPYSSLDDLRRVKGIGDITLQKIKDQGLACVNCGATPESSPSPSPVNTPASAASTPSPSPVYQYSQNILINEFLPYPEKDDKEWVELINNDSSSVNLSGWQIDDDDNTTAPQLIPENTTIAAGQLLVISFNKSTLNNDGDKVRLLWPDDQAVHAVSFSKASQGQAVARFDAGWLWTNQPTPGQTNKKSVFAKSESVTASSSAAGQISAIEESVPAETKIASQSAPTTKTTTPTPSLSEPPTANINLAASIPSPTNPSNLKTTLSLVGVLVLAGLTAWGLVYFRRTKQVDTESFDD